MRVLHCFVLFCFFVSFHKVRPPIMVESIIERHSHSRVEYLVKVGVELVWTIHEHTMNTHTMSHSDVLHLSSPPTLLSLPSPLLSLLFPSSPSSPLPYSPPFSLSSLPSSPPPLFVVSPSLPLYGYRQRVSSNGLQLPAMWRSLYLSRRMQTHQSSG